jgi:hypothetical protein
MPGRPRIALRHPGIHIHQAEVFTLPRSFGCGLDADNLLDHDGAELQGLLHHSLLVVAEATTKRNGGGHDGGDNDNALQTLHGLLSFG